MVKLSEIIQEGWPNHKQSVPKQVSEYWAFRDELVATDGLIFKGETIVIPQASRKDILLQIHEGHLGIERSKLSMTKQIDEMVSNCSICQELRFSNPREPMIPHEIPQYPWQVVATDLFAWNGGNYVVVVNCYSPYWEMASLRNMASTAVIDKLRRVFTRHGILKTVKSDNGPQYSSDEFATFPASWNFSHVTSSPKYPQSNGLAEKTANCQEDVGESQA